MAESEYIFSHRKMKFWRGRVVPKISIPYRNVQKENLELCRKFIIQFLFKYVKRQWIVKDHVLLLGKK